MFLEKKLVGSLKRTGHRAEAGNYAFILYAPHENVTVVAVRVECRQRD